LWYFLFLGSYHKELEGFVLFPSLSLENSISEHISPPFFHSNTPYLPFPFPGKLHTRTYLPSLLSLKYHINTLAHNSPAKLKINPNFEEHLQIKLQEQSGSLTVHVSVIHKTCYKYNYSF
jgi:hypothetical protein